MEKPERIRRWRALYDNVTREDVTAWRDSFVAALEGKGALRPAALAL
jgi:trehalose 6-phosphate synthase